MCPIPHRSMRAVVTEQSSTVQYSDDFSKRQPERNHIPDEYRGVLIPVSVTITIH